MNIALEVRPGRMLNLAIYDNPASLGTIFMIHGGGGRSMQWREQIAALQNHYTLIVPDLLGHGVSAKPIPGKNNPYEFIEFYLDLQIIFEKYAAANNIVMGHSYGGALAAYLASRNQERVNKLILLAASRCQPGTGLPFIYQLPLFILNYIRPFLKKRFREAAFAPMTPLELIAEENLGGSNNQLYVIKALLKATPNIPLLNVSQLNIPTLIIAGKYDKIISNVNMIAFYDNLPKRSISVIEEGAHMLMLEKPQHVNELILEFIKS